MRLLRSLSEPWRGLSVLLSLAVTAAAVGLADIPAVLGRADMLRGSTLVLIPALAGTYLALKGWQFGGLLAASGLESSPRARWLASAVGEITLTLPFGVYAQNYVLKKAQGTQFADSAATTTAMLALEIAFLLAVLAVLPIPGWPQMRPTMWGLLIVGALLTIPMRPARHLRITAHRYAARGGRIGVAAQGLLGFSQRLRAIARPRVLAGNALLTALYMLTLMFAFLHVADHVSHARIDFVQAITVYSFGLLIAMSLGGVLSQLGVLELSAAAAAHAWGLDLQEGLAMLLWFRLLWTASVWLISGAIIVTLSRELRRLSTENH